MNTTNQGTVWVCVDCYVAHHYGVTLQGRLDGAPIKGAVMSLLVDYDITDGLVADQHECSAVELALGECQCGELNFSKTPCEGCGSTLAGSREALTLWSHP